MALVKVEIAGLTVEAIKKYVANMTHVRAGRMDHVRKNIRSTKLQHVLNTILHDLRPDLKSSASSETNDLQWPQQHKSTDDYYAKIENLHKIYTDQTGRFPTTSSNGMQYCFVLYSFDANAILVEPIKQRSASELLRAHQKLVQYLTERGYKPNMHYLDNEAPQCIKSYDVTNKITYQLVPPFSHRRNAAERAIRTWKNHFITGLCSVDPNFPMHLWDRLIPQSVITLNLLRASRRDPTISAYTALNGPFNYDATPLAPPGCKVIAFEAPQHRKSFAPHGIPAWYIGPTLEHYRCYKVYVPKTRAKRICDTVSFHPHLCETPVLQPLEQAVIAADKLTTALQQVQSNNMATSKEQTSTLQALEKLSNIFWQRLQQRQNLTQSPRVLNASNNFHPPPPKVFQQTTPPKRPVPHCIPLDTAEIPSQQPQAPVCASTATPPRQHRYNTRLNVTKYSVNAVIDEKSGKSMEYRHLIHNPKYKQVWSDSMSNELGRLTQGNRRVQRTNTMYFLPYENIPIDRRKDVTHARIVVDYRPQK